MVRLKAIENSLQSNPYQEVRLNVQKSVRVVVPEKFVKADGGKDSTVVIR